MITTTTLQTISERAVEGMLHGFKVETKTTPNGFKILFQSSIELSELYMNGGAEIDFFNSIKKMLQDKLNGTVFINEMINDLTKQNDMLKGIIAKHEEAIKILMDKNDDLKQYESFFILTKQLNGLKK